MTLLIEETRDIATCRALRRVVFIEEQGVSEADEIDDLDGEAIHLLAVVAGRPVGTARLLLQGETGKIGRVCVLAEARGAGIGAALLRRFHAEGARVAICDIDGAAVARQLRAYPDIIAMQADVSDEAQMQAL